MLEDLRPRSDAGFALVCRLSCSDGLAAAEQSREAPDVGRCDVGRRRGCSLA